MKWSINIKISYSKENKKFTGWICILNLKKKNEKVFLKEQSLDIKGERRSQRKWVRLYLKVAKDETSELTLGN